MDFVLVYMFIWFLLFPDSLGRHVGRIMRTVDAIRDDKEI